MSVSIVFVGPIGRWTIVSVPYGDHVCLNLCRGHERQRGRVFPSPMGIMSVSMMQELMMMINNPGFPSPMGIMSVSIREIRKRNIEQQEGFRPLWGSCLSQSGSQRYGQERQSFRPLWGSCLSQLLIYAHMHLTNVVSVPYGDHVCLNLHCLHCFLSSQ